MSRIGYLSEAALLRDKKATATKFDWWNGSRFPGITEIWMGEGSSSTGKHRCSQHRGRRGEGKGYVCSPASSVLVM